MKKNKNKTAVLKLRTDPKPKPKLATNLLELKLYVRLSNVVS